MTTSLFSQLDLGKRAMQAQQAGMNTAGHNIANVDNENFSRQRVELESQHPFRSRFGAGVDIDGVSRVADNFLTKRLVSEQSRWGNATTRDQGLRRLEAIFAEVEGHGLRSALNDFWGAWGRLATNPEREVSRKDLLDSGVTLATRINGMDREFTNYRKELNGRIAERVERANQLAGQIAQLNIRIQQTDRGKGEANDLRDEREGALKELSLLMKIDWRENEHKVVNVSIGNGFPLVHGRKANTLEASFDHNEVGYFSLRGIDPKGISRDLTKVISSGELSEYIALRDEVMVGFQEQLNELAAEVAFRVNSIHNGGTGLQTSFDRLTSSFALRPDAVHQPVPFLKDGVFRIHMVSPENDILETIEVGVEAGTDTVADIVNRINATVANPTLLQARVNSEGSVTIESMGPYDFVLGQDTSGFSTIMGFNNFFENLEGARDFRVNPRLLENPNRISTGHELLPGDNSAAIAITELQFSPTMRGESVTFDEYYNGMMAELGLRINRAQEDKRNQEIIVDQFQKLRDEVASVNMDEEVADMVQYQRGFEAAAKFISTVDEMTETVIRM